MNEGILVVEALHPKIKLKANELRYMCFTDKIMSSVHASTLCRLEMILLSMIIMALEIMCP